MSRRTRADMFLDPADDPREGGPSLGDERATLAEFLRGQRLTLELKCADLSPEQLAARAVEVVRTRLVGDRPARTPAGYIATERGAVTPNFHST